MGSLVRAQPGELKLKTAVRGLFLFNFMYCVYILYSQKLKRFYIGTSDNVYRRLDEHNAGLKKDAFTYRGIPWEIFIIIENLETDQAYQIEDYLKRMKSSAYLRKLKEQPEILIWIRDRFK